MANTVTKSNGDVLLANTMPKAEYMYGCTATSVGMLLGYYDLYGYGGVKFTNLIAGTVELESRGTDGNAYDMDAFDTVLGKAIASEGYVKRFYGTTPEEELPYTFKGDTTELNTDAWDCIADYLGTGQWWRGNGDKSTTETYGTLEHLYKVTQTGTLTSGSITRTFPYRNVSMLYGLELYVKSRGYSLDTKQTGTFKVDVNEGTFTFEDYKAEIDAGRPVIVSVVGHAMVGYGYNASTREIIFDDCYKSDQRMTWDGLYDYSGQKRALESITTVVFIVDGVDTVAPVVTDVKASTTAPTNQDVKVSAVFVDNMKLASALYRIGESGSWSKYVSGGVTVSKNATVYFKAIDGSGNESAIVSYKVTNIDKTPPSKPTASADVTSSTTNPVLVTAKFSDDSAKKEYSLDNKTWKTYSGAVKFTSNGTVYFRGTDAAGNVSDVVSYKVKNIKNSTPDPDPDPDPGYDTSGCDDCKNDWLVAKDKSGKTLRNSDTNFASSTVTKAGVEIKLDTKSVSNGGKHNFVGYDDEADFAKINLNSAAKLSFTATATGASKLAVYSVTTSFDKKGNAVYSKKQIKSVTLKQGKGESEYTGSLDGLLLDPNSGCDYYVAMESTSAKKGAYYNVTVDSDSVFFTRGNNNDDWDDWKEWGTAGHVGSIGTLTKMTEAALVDDWVGYGDEVDYKKFSLTSAAKICLEVDALAPVKISICKFEVKTDKKGKTTYSLKTLCSATTTTKFSDGVWCAIAKPVLLEKGDYYIRVESTTAKKGASATYSLYLANYNKKSETKFYNQSQSNNNDDWVYDKETKKLNNNFASYTISNATILLGDWVGFGDAVDYRKFEVKSNAKVSFCITCAGPTKFTVYRLVTKTDKKGSTTYSLKTLQSTSFKAGSDKKATKLLKLTAGETYYFSMESTNAKSGGESHYDVDVAQYVSLPAGGKNSGALAMPEGIGSAQDLLSFGSYGGSADVLADISAVSGLDSLSNDGSAWQDVAKLA